MNIRIFFVKTVQIGNKKIPTDGITGSNADLTAVHCTGLQDLRFSAPDQVYGRFHMAEQDLTFWCELHFLGTADEQSLIQLFSSALMDWLTADCEM